MLFGIVSNPEHVDIEKVRALLKEDKGPKDDVDKQFIVNQGLQSAKGKEKVRNEKGVQINYNGKIKTKKILDYLDSLKFHQIK
jgi:hypothetical protein